MTGRLRLWLLLASLALNLFLGGLLVGRVVSGPPALPHPLMEDSPGVLLGSFRAVERTLSAEQRTALRRDTVGQMAQLRRDARAVMAARRAVAAAMVEDPFQPEQFDAALETLRLSLLDAQEGAHVLFSRVMATLDADQRRALLESLRRDGPPGVGRHHRPPDAEAR